MLLSRGGARQAGGTTLNTIPPDLDLHDIDDPETDLEAVGGHAVTVSLPEDAAGERLDKALTAHIPELSRARLQALMAQGQVSLDGVVLSDLSAKARPGVAYVISIPAPSPADPQPQNIPLEVLFEDEHLIVIDKPAGMAAHPAPGTTESTLVNALLYHCAGSLSGIGGVLRPGIVHRLDKDTSGVMVAAKTDAAHRALSDMFARHDMERVYIALTRGAPTPAKDTITTLLGRSNTDRKKMAVLRRGGREAITHYTVERAFTPKASPNAKAPPKPLAARISCRLETGRTHQIRVHLASRGAPCLGDTTYGSGSPSAIVREALEASGLKRQALHAAVLGFVHPITWEKYRFETPPPADMAALETELQSRFF